MHIHPPFSLSSFSFHIKKFLDGVWKRLKVIKVHSHLKVESETFPIFKRKKEILSVLTSEEPNMVEKSNAHFKEIIRCKSSPCCFFLFPVSRVQLKSLNVDLTYPLHIVKDGTTKVVWWWGPGRIWKRTRLHSADSKTKCHYQLEGYLYWNGEKR